MRLTQLNQFNWFYLSQNALQTVSLANYIWLNHHCSGPVIDCIKSISFESLLSPSISSLELQRSPVLIEFSSIGRSVNFLPPNHIKAPSNFKIVFNGIRTNYRNIPRKGKRLCVFRRGWGVEESSPSMGAIWNETQYLSWDPYFQI